MKSLTNKKAGSFRLLNIILLGLLLVTIYGTFNELFYFKRPFVTAGKIEKVLPETELVTQHVTRHYWLADIAFSSAKGKTYRFIGNQQYVSEPAKGTVVSITYDAANPNHARLSSTLPQYPLFIFVVLLELLLLAVLNLGFIKSLSELARPRIYFA